MSYQALARKWRPKDFSDMVGQGHVLKALTNALSQQRLHHAYLFTGTRGVGKTTIARIFAKALNCDEGVSASPCGQCSACVEVDSGRFVDLIEVDAASRTKVEDTRDLLDNVQYLPTRGRYKVYLIDEVHMLSNSSFNALLKTLEEPPPHVIFLLATTDPQKMPVTVLSRCLQFHLKAFPPEQIVARLQHILVSEKVAFEDKTLPLVAKAANGSLRDALSLLDQAIAHGQGVLNFDEVRDMLGFVDLTSLAGIVDAICVNDVRALMAAVDAMDAYSPDYAAVLDELLSLYHASALIQQVLDSAYAENELASRLSHALTAEVIQLHYQIALHGKRDLPLAPSAKEGLQMCLLRLLVFMPDQEERPPVKKNKAAQRTSIKTPEAVAAHVTSEGSTKEADWPQVEEYEAAPELHKVDNVEQGQAPILAASQMRDTSLGAQWLAWLDAMKIPGLLDNLARNTALLGQDDDKIELGADAQRVEMFNSERKDELTAHLCQFLGRRVSVIIREVEGVVTATQLMREREAAKQAAAEQAIYADPRLKELLELTGGRVLADSIRSLH